MSGGPTDAVLAFRPQIAGVAEVLHARWRAHSYPAHTHSTWTVLIVDAGAIGYDVDRRHALAPPRSGVTVLPPHVPHDGHALTDRGFAKRVLYLEEDQLDPARIGRLVDAPLIEDPALRDQVGRIHRALGGHDDLEAAERLALVIERLGWHLAGRPEHGHATATPAPRLAALVRERLDADPLSNAGLAEPADALGVSVPHLIRTFTAAYGISPHRYLIGRRLDRARALLLDQVPAAEVATRAGFFDQSHLTRHFSRFLGTTPRRYQRSAGR